MYGRKKSPAEKSCFKMTPKSPMLVALKGDQYKLNKELRQAILDSPAKKKCKKCGSPMCMCGPKHRK